MDEVISCKDDERKWTIADLNIGFGIEGQKPSRIAYEKSNE